MLGTAYLEHPCGRRCERSSVAGRAHAVVGSEHSKLWGMRSEASWEREVWGRTVDDAIEGVCVWCWLMRRATYKPGRHQLTLHAKKRQKRLTAPPH